MPLHCTKYPLSILIQQSNALIRFASFVNQNIFGFCSAKIWSDFYWIRIENKIEFIKNGMYRMVDWVARIINETEVKPDCCRFLLYLFISHINHRMSFNQPKYKQKSNFKCISIKYYKKMHTFYHVMQVLRNAPMATISVASV